MPDFDAIIRGYMIVGMGKGRSVIIGTIHEDKKQRWWDGARVRTSLVQTIEDLEDGRKLATTLNTKYLLEEPAEFNKSKGN